MMMQPPPTSTEPIVINLTPPEVKIAAGGEPVELIAHVRNAGSTVDQYSIELENIDPSWFTIMVQSVSLFPGDSAPIPIRLHPPKGSATRAGHHTFIVRARSHADPSLLGVTKGVINVSSYAIFQIELAPKRVTGSRGKFRLNISNGGNNEAQLELTGRDPESKLGFRFQKAAPTLQPGTKLSMPMTVRPRGLRLVGEVTKYPFAVTARPVDGTDKDAKEVEGELVHQPRFKSWKMPLIFLAALLLILGWITFKPPINPCDIRYYIPYQAGSAPFYAGMLCRGNNFAPFTPVEEAKVGCTSGPGFTEVRTAHEAIVGECVEDEWGDELGNVHQRTQKGELLYILKPPNDPEIYFFDQDKRIFAFVRPDDPGATFEDSEAIEVKKPEQ